MVIEREDWLQRLRLVQASGFTLLEVMLVVTVLAFIAGGAVLALTSAKEDTEVQLARSEMMAIKQAILKFKQDTGYFPKQGPFDLEAPHAPCTPSNPNGFAKLPLGSTRTRDWYCSPANFYQLYENPLVGTGHPLGTWNSDTRRGWRGPYLSRFGEGLVDAGNGLGFHGDGDLTGGTTELYELAGVADSFVGKALSVIFGGVPATILEWRSTPMANPNDPNTQVKAHPSWGRPYLVFDLDDQGPADTLEARIVSMGPNGTYDCDRDGVGGCTLADNCDRNGDNVCDAADALLPALHDLCAPPAGKDDIVLCILR